MTNGAMKPYDKVAAKLLRVPTLLRFREIALRGQILLLPMLISIGLGPYRQTPLLQGSPRLSIDAHSVFSRSAHVAGLVTSRQTFVRRCHWSEKCLEFN
jgi:hypothetical protein